ncbi:uncharacterized protein LOC142229573 [Haematobia irritans]|uniref:uncharacterized protein LOC142229573 n=1 Tax=Haematobia irritans TaxID=7368 RepID=UPI003F506F32
MDQFSHDLTLALDQMDLDRVSRWGQQRRRTRSTGNLPCAPQPTEDSSSPTDVANAPSVQQNTNNNDGLDTQNINLPSDSDDKEELTAPRLTTCKQNTSRLLGTLESDSLNEAFSPARFFKPSARRKRKLKRISMDYETIGAGGQSHLTESPSVLVIEGSSTNTPAGCPSGMTMRKRVLKPEFGSRQMFFCGKRKRSNRDRYQEHDHSSSVPRHNSHLDELGMRPRSFSSTSKPHSDRLLPLNKGLLSKIERISQLQKTESAKCSTNTLFGATISDGNEILEKEINNETLLNDDNASAMVAEEILVPENDPCIAVLAKAHETNFRIHRKKKSGQNHRRRPLQFAVDQHSMDCEEFNSSSSLSSSDSDDHAVNDTDREGDDELTDWPGNENNCSELKYDSKRKLTKRNTLPQIKSDPESVGSLLMAEDDTIMSNSGNGDNSQNWTPSSDANREVGSELPYTSSEPIAIVNKMGFSSLCRTEMTSDDINLPMKQIESEMSGETSNPFLSSPPCQPSEVREIRAGCRRVKGERPGFSIKTSVNERLARFLQDPRLVQIRLPDIEIYEHESLVNLAHLYSLKMSLDNGCAVLNKTSNTTQSVNIDQQGLQGGLFSSDFKRRCYDNKDGELVHNK